MSALRCAPLEIVRRGRRVEQRQDLELFADAQFLEIGGHIVPGVFEHAGQRRRVEQGVEPAALVPAQQLERLGDVALVVILEPVSQLPGRKVAAQQRRDLALVVRVAVAGGDLRQDVVLFGHIVFLLCAKASGVRGKRHITCFAMLLHSKKPPSHSLSTPWVCSSGRTAGPVAQ